MRLALYFQRKAADIDQPFDILADAALLKVVQTATGLSPLTAGRRHRQAGGDDLGPPGRRRTCRTRRSCARFLTRFTSLWDAEQPHPRRLPSPAIVAGQPLTIGFSADLLASLAEPEAWGHLTGGSLVSYVGLSAQVALERRLDTIAQNVANLGTAGYRAEEVTFDTVMSKALGQDPVAYASGG